MASVDALRRHALRLDDTLAKPWAVPVALSALCALTLYLRSRQLHAGFWIDEGLSVGIAHHSWSSLVHVLRHDGSPPGYYLLLRAWIAWFGDGERATHALSLVFGVACVPLAYAAGRVLFDRRTGLVCALLAALNPYLTYYAQETRMYELEAFLSLVICLAYVQAIVRGRRRWAPLLVLGLAGMVYTHNWALFLCVGLAVATAVVARERLGLFAIVAAAVAVLYLPWVTSLLFQVRHTGAPWASVPSWRDLIVSPGAVLSGDGPLVALALAAGVGLGALVRGRETPERTVVTALAWAAGVTIVSAWLVSQFSPSWTTRYFAVVVGPLLVLAARGVVRAGRFGVAALVIVVFFWVGYKAKDDKENARAIAAGIGAVRPGELVISTHPEQVPVLRYYLGPNPRFATTLGPVADDRAFDWVDAVDRLRDAKPKPTLDRLIASVPKGREFVVVTPVFRDYRAWRAKWTKLVWQKSQAWTQLLQADPRVRLERRVASDEIALHRTFFKPLQAFVYRRVG
ncbi:MAG TPA: glycosyltransferase family 39 protein [Gaiellaceae bacterium]|nr:glycosyltransferase family 39 protein [Gaiellaceae bacterium]